MKLKGISVFEQHIEKAVLVVFAAAAVGVFVLQIFGQPNAIQIGQKTVAPDAVSDEVITEANRMKGQIEGDGSNVEIPDLEGPLARIEQMLARPVSPLADERLALARPWSADTIVSPGAIVPEGDGLGNPYVEIVPPAPTGTLARAFAGTIDPLEPAATTELQGYLPAAQPFDKRAVTIQASFDAAALRAALAAIPSNQSINPLPTAWWQQRVEILDFEVVRQEMYDDGTFGPEEEVAPLPGRFSLRARIRDNTTQPRDLPAILRDENDNRGEIRRPSYYRMIAGDPWVWPARAAEMQRVDPEVQKQVDLLVARYRKLEGEAGRVRDRLESLGGSPDFEGGSGGARQRGDAGHNADSPWPYIPPTWLAQQGRPQRPPGGERDPAEERRRREARALRDKLKNLETELADIKTQLSELGYGVDGRPLQSDSIGTFEEPLISITGADAPDTVTLWTHDINAEPGRAYRYQARVWITNPLFGNGAFLPEPQQDLATRPAIQSEASEWTAVIRTFPEQAYFVSDAVDGANIAGFAGRSPSSATVDVYRFFYGYWRGGSVRLEPGDQVRLAMELPDLPIFTIETVEGTPRVTGSETLPTAFSVEQEVLLLEIGKGLGLAGELMEVIFASLTANSGLDIRIAEQDAQSDLAAEAWSSRARAATSEVRQPGSGGSDRRPADAGGRPRDASPGQIEQPMRRR